MQHVVAQQTLARCKSILENIWRTAGKQLLQGLDGTLRRRILLPFNAPGARRIAHMEAAGHRINTEHRSGLRRAALAALLGVCRNGQGVRCHERTDVFRVFITQRQIGDFRIQQRVLATARRR